MKPDRKKVTYTIVVMGKLTYNTVKDLCLPGKPTDKSFEEVCKLLKNYFKPLVVIVAEAYKFHQAKLELGESVSMYANRLRRLSANCHYEQFLSRVLRDQFVCGIRNTNTLKLLSQDLTFKECLDKALADKAADKESRDLATSMLPFSDRKA